MKEKLTEEILAILKDTRGFVTEQAPDVIQQMLASHFFEYVVWGILSAVVALALTMVLVWYLRRKPERYSDGDLKGLFGSFLAAGILGATIAVICNLGSAYQLKSYPKAYLVEQLTKRSCCK